MVRKIVVLAKVWQSVYIGVDKILAVFSHRGNFRLARIFAMPKLGAPTLQIISGLSFFFGITPETLPKTSVYKTEQN